MVHDWSLNYFDVHSELQTLLSGLETWQLCLDGAMESPPCSVCEKSSDHEGLL